MCGGFGICIYFVMNVCSIMRDAVYFTGEQRKKKCGLAQLNIDVAQKILRRDFEWCCTFKCSCIFMRASFD